MHPAPARRTPALLPTFGAARVTALSAGEYHAVVALEDGSVRVWGAGAGSERAPVPVKGLPKEGRAVAVAAGYQHSVAVIQGGCGETRVRGGELR